MMKKLLAIFASLCMAFSTIAFASCSALNTDNSDVHSSSTSTEPDVSGTSSNNEPISPSPAPNDSSEVTEPRKTVTETEWENAFSVATFDNSTVSFTEATKRYWDTEVYSSSTNEYFFQYDLKQDGTGKVYVEIAYPTNDETSTCITNKFYYTQREAAAERLLPAQFFGADLDAMKTLYSKAQYNEEEKYFIEERSTENENSYSKVTLGFEDGKLVFVQIETQIYYQQPVPFLLYTLSTVYVSEYGTTEIPAHEHAFAGEWQVSLEPYQCNDGLSYRQCTGCSQREYQVIPAGHKFEKRIVKEAIAVNKCTEKMKYYYSCECGKIGEEIFETADYGEHSFEAGFCTACGCAYYSQGLKYEASEDGTYLIVCGMGTCEDVSLVLPSEHNGKPVQEIRYSAFQNNRALTSIIIPETIKKIGWEAFRDCVNVTNIKYNPIRCEIETAYNVFHAIGTETDGCIVCIGQNVEEIPDSLFSGASKNIVEVAFEENSKCTSIGENAFSDCKTLNRIVLPNSLESIGAGAFGGCSNLSGILELPKSIRFIGDSAFHWCYGLDIIKYQGTLDDWCKVELGGHIGYSTDSLAPSDYLIDGKSIMSWTTLELPNDLTSIGDYQFRGWGITSVEIPNNVKTIGISSFAMCYNLTEIIIPDSVTSIGDSAFYGCSSLTNITIPEGVTSIENSAFENCSNLTSITIPNSVTSIGEYAFCNCLGLESVTINNDVTSIGYFAFGYCPITTATIPTSAISAIPKDNLRTVVITSGSSIEDSAFYYCRSLTTITISDSVTSIGGSAFGCCDNLTNITIGDGVTSIGEFAFYNCPITTATIPMSAISSFPKNSLTTVVITSGSSIGEFAFYNCSSLTSVTLPDSITSIDQNAFYDCSVLTYNTYDNALYLGNSDNPYFALIKATSQDIPSCEIHENTKVIGGGAFSVCRSLTSITIPDSVTSIGSYAFGDCNSLTSITIPNSVTSIGSYAFDHCNYLTSITIPDSVTTIGEEAFVGCYSLTSITVSKSHASFASIDGNLYSKDGTVLIQYAIGKTDTTFTIPNGVTSIGSYAFGHCSSLTNVTIGDSVTSIGSYAFVGCYYLTNITISDSVTTIGKDAFGGCSSLTNVTIGNSVTTIGKDAFGGCSSLTNVTIGNGVTSIEESAFYNCSNLTSITFTGTMEQWNAISKGYDWNYNVPATEVVCLDGTVTL